MRNDQRESGEGEMDVITMGLLVTDMLVNPVTADFLKRESTHLSIRQMPGGDACNVALNCAAMGLETGIVSAVGRDAGGIFLKSYLEEHGVEISGIKMIEKEPTGISLVMIEPDGERHFLSDTEIMAQVCPELLEEERLASAKVLSFNSFYRMKPMMEGGTAELFRRAHQHGVITVMDTIEPKCSDPLRKILPALRETDVFLPSFREAVMITGTEDVRKMRSIFAETGIKILAVKMGGSGSYVTDFHEEAMVPACHVEKEKIVSTTGAGDSYAAGFISAILHGYDWRECAAIASAAASLTIQTAGASGAIRSWEQVLEAAGQATNMQ